MKTTLTDIIKLAEAKGWFVTWWFNHHTWAASFKDKTIFRNTQEAKTYEEAYLQFLEQLFEYNE